MLKSSAEREAMLLSKRMVSESRASSACSCCVHSRVFSACASGAAGGGGAVSSLSSCGLEGEEDAVEVDDREREEEDEEE